MTLKTHVALPLIIFPSLFIIGCRYMYIDHFSGGLDKTINALCFPSSPLNPSTFSLTLPPTQSYIRPYTYIPQIDLNELGPCNVVVFFHLLLDAPTTVMGQIPEEFATYLLGTGMPCVLAMLVEAYRYRGRQHWLLSYPTFWLLMTQTITFGMTFPLYWLLLVMSRSSRGSNGAPEKPIASLITRGEAKGLALGLAFGAVLPSAALIIMKDTYATWLWQPYPIFVAIIRAVYSRIVAPTKPKPKATPPEKKGNVSQPASKATTGESGSLTIIRTIFLFTFLLSSYIHIRAVWPRVWNRDLSTLYDLLVLTKAPPSDAHPSIQALSFFKWDYALSYSAFSLGLLWLARSFEEVLGMVLCDVVLTPVLGTGAATVFIYGVMCQL